MDMVEQRKSLPQAVPSSICYSHVSRKPSEVRIDLFSGPALRALDRYLVVRPEKIMRYYVRCCQRSGGQRSWKAVHMLAAVFFGPVFPATYEDHYKSSHGA